MGCLETDRLSSDLPDGWGMDPYLSIFSEQERMSVGVSGQMCIDIRHSIESNVWSDWVRLSVFHVDPIGPSIALC